MEDIKITRTTDMEVVVITDTAVATEATTATGEVMDTVVVTTDMEEVTTAMEVVITDTGEVTTDMGVVTMDMGVVIMDMVVAATDTAAADTDTAEAATDTEGTAVGMGEVKADMEETTTMDMEEASFRNLASRLPRSSLLVLCSNTTNPNHSMAQAA